MLASLKSGFSIDTIKASDRDAYVEHLKEKEIYDFTLAIPYPYTQTHAEWYIDHIEQQTKVRNGIPVNFCIRNPQGQLIGGCGYHDLEPGKSHKAEIGYWLSKSYWGKGIMTEVVKYLVNHGFEQFDLARITATVFAHNQRSARVLEKTEFQKEGVLRKHYQKDGKVFDGILYARIHPKFEI
jgi:ribosomal-protein-alanine N-acetyltransferase